MRASTSFSLRVSKQDVDGRDKPGHDGGMYFDMDYAPNSANSAYLRRCAAALPNSDDSSMARLR